MTIGALVSELATVLDERAVPEARAEARDLVAAVVNEPRFWPSLNAAAPAPRDVARHAREAALRRAQGAPFAYAVGRAAFRHLVLAVDERVLIPRQETELLVDLVLAARQGMRGGVVADIGTGSGAIALALASEGAFDRIIATDLAQGALDVARSNAERHKGRDEGPVTGDGGGRPHLRCPVDLRCGCALAPVEGEVLDVIVSNPPYIAFGEAAELPGSVRDWEPATALLSAGNGLAVTAEIVRGAPSVLRAGGLLALETDSRRAEQVAQLVSATAAFHQVTVHRDLAGRDRFVLAIRGPDTMHPADSSSPAMPAAPA